MKEFVKTSMKSNYKFKRTETVFCLSIRRISKYFKNYLSKFFAFSTIRLKERILPYNDHSRKKKRQNLYDIRDDVLAPRKTFVRQRSEGVPYIYEYPNIGYPVAHSIDHSVGLSSKHLVVVSFIGLLLLLAIIQNTITAIKRRDTLVDVLSTRQKRDVYDTRDLNSVTSEQEDVWNDDARLRCVQRTVCLENQKLFKYLGNIGKILAKYLTRGIEKSFKSSSGWDRLVDDAGAAGIRGDDCNVLYRDCDTPISSNRRHDPNESEQHENQLKHTYKKRRK